MHKKRLAICFAIVFALLAWYSVGNAEEADKPAAPASQPAAAPAAQPPAQDNFDQEAALEKFWKAPDDAVVATVNGEAITKGELLRAVWDWNAPATLEDLIQFKMVKQAAAKAGVTVDPQEIESKAQEQIGRGSGTDWKTVLRRYNVPPARVRSRMEASLLVEKAVKKDIAVTEAQFAEWIKASHILIRINNQEPDKNKADADAKAKAEKVIADLKAGKSFEELAKEVSDDTVSKEKGGSLGWGKRGTWVKEFSDAAFGTGDKPGMKAGEISQAPVKSFFGYHIIRVDKLGKEATGSDKEELRDLIIQESVAQQSQPWFSKVRGEAKVVNEINPPLPPEPMPGMGMMTPAQPPSTSRPAAASTKPEASKSATEPAKQEDSKPAASSKSEAPKPAAGTEAKASKPDNKK